MAILELSDIKNIIKAGSPAWVEQSQKESIRLNVHVNGVGTADYLKRFYHYENDRQFQLRRDIATSNRFSVADLMRPVDKVFSSKGGGKIFKLKNESKQEEMRGYLNDFADGMNITKWIQNIQANKYYSDPAGLVFFEWGDEETYPTIKSIQSIFNYKSSGRLLDWVVFSPFKIKSESGDDIPGDFYRVVDDQWDYLIKVLDESITIIEDKTYLNVFNRVPAIINSDIIGFTLKYNESPIEDQVDLLDHYLRTTSVKNIYEFLHGYPIFWAYTQPCRKCDGTGLYEGRTCPECNGARHTLRKDVSDVIALKAPKDGEPKIAPDVAGYVQPDLNTWEQQRTELTWLSGLMQYSMWGTAVNEKGDNETATGKWIDTQPVNDRLNKFADAFEDMEQKMTNLIGIFYFGDVYEGSSINYGRRFLVEPPDVIWAKYQNARESGSPKIALDYLLIQFYQAEYANDIESLAIAQKSLRLEPFIHKTDEQIQALTAINLNDKKRKAYFNEWYKTLDEIDILTKELKVLAAEFDEYISSIASEPTVKPKEEEINEGG